MATVINQPHRRGLADPESRLLEFALGRLRFGKLITAKQFTAGKRFIRDAEDYGRIMGFPSIRPTSPGYGLVISSSGPEVTRDYVDPTSEEQEDRDTRTMREYQAVISGLCDAELDGAKGLMVAVDRVLIRDEYPEHDWLKGAVCQALDIMAETYGY